LDNSKINRKEKFKENKIENKENIESKVKDNVEIKNDLEVLKNKLRNSS
jgi:hypothetical protein